MKKEDVAFILNVLRQGTITWDGRKACLRRARKKVFDRFNKKTKEPIYKLQWQCQKCGEWTKSEQEMEVDHVVEIGGFKGDWNDIINRMYDRDPKALQALCGTCHQKKTAAFMNAMLRFTRKK